MTFDYPRGWSVALTSDSREGHHFFVAEGRCEGRISGSMEGANHPARRGDGTFCPDFDGVISTDDGAQVLFHIGGYGRAYPEGARQIVSWLTHVSDDPRYRWLNDAALRRDRRGTSRRSLARRRGTGVGATTSMNRTPARATMEAGSAVRCDPAVQSHAGGAWHGWTER